MSTFKVAIFLLIIFVGIPGIAQEKWTFTFRPGINFLTQDISDSNTKTGYGFDFTGNYRVLNYVDVYAGWGWNQFNGGDFLSTKNSTINLNGFSLGFRYLHPIKDSAIAYSLMAGAIYEHLEVEYPAGEITAESGHDLGWQIGGGLSYTFGENWMLRPELRYRALSAAIDLPSESNDINLNYISFGIGLGFSF